jgi:hypothetical protein
MSATLLPSATQIVLAGSVLAGTTPDAVNGNLFQNNGRQQLWVKNGDSGSHTMTILAYPQGNSPEGLVVTNPAVVLAAGTEQMVGPFPPSIFNNASSQVGLTWDASTSMNIQVIQATDNPN